MARVLLVEDDASLHLLYRVRLKQIGYEVVAVTTGAQAVEAVNHENIDVVLLDLDLPDYDGLQLLQEIIVSRPALPVIIHSGHEFGGIDFRSWGAAAYVVKSPNFSKLQTALAQFAPQAPSWRKLAAQAQVSGMAAAF